MVSPPTGLSTPRVVLPAKPARRSGEPEPPRSSLGPADWIRAALQSLPDEGPAGLSVEGLARTLGVTKGSFYWHFSSREHLLREALAAWERDMGSDLDARFLGIADPRERLRILMFAAFEDRANGLLFSTLLAHGADPLVGPVLRRVSTRQMELGVGSFLALGCDAAEARRRSTLLYSAYAGYFSLQRVAGETVGAVADLSAFAKELLDALLPPPRKLPRRGAARPQ